MVAVLADFYRRAEGGGEITQFGTAEAVAVNVLENFEQTQSFIGQGALGQKQFDSIRSYAQKFLGNEALFQQRIDGGYIRDCHGDLYSANICLADKVYIYDCIEFNQRFRYCDVASDVAFLAMDLEYYGLDSLAGRFIEQFVANPALMAKSTTRLLSTGKAPGSPMQVGHVWLFGSPPNSVLLPQKILLFVRRCACTSRPITPSYVP